LAALLEIQNIVCGYDGGVVLEDLSLSVKAGEKLGILGRNGVGKTTLIKAIMGQVPVASGSINFGGKRISGLPSYKIAKSGIGYVPQGREIFAGFSVRENLLMGNLKAQNFDHVFELFPVLAQRIDSKAGSFSGGQQQQLAIARALVSEPDILLLDEPSEGVQPSIVTEIGQVLSAIASETGTAVVLVEQNIELVLDTCHRCVFVEDGTIAASHATGELRENPKIIEQFMGL